MVVEPIHCPACQGTEVVKHGKTSDGKQRFRCQHETCTGVTFRRDYVYQGRRPAVKRQRVLRTFGEAECRRLIHAHPWVYLLACFC